MQPAGGWALGQSYYDTHIGLVKTQPAKAGVRLAAMLNRILAPR